MNNPDFCHIDVKRYLKEPSTAEKPKWRWWLLPLSPIAIPIGFAIGVYRGLRNLQRHVDGDPDDDGGDDIYRRCKRQLKDPTESELAIHRAVYEIGNYLIRTRETPWDAPGDWREPTLEELDDFYKVDAGEKKP